MNSFSIMTFKLFIVLLSLGAFAEVKAQQAEVNILDFEEFEPLLNKKNDTVYVINFWATWCVPCVKELPDFEKLNTIYADQNFKMILVSLDFRSSVESRVIPFIADKNLKAEVVLLHEPDANAWINKVNPAWSGAIPATIIYKNDFLLFHEGSYTYEELNQIVQPLINE